MNLDDLQRIRDAATPHPRIAYLSKEQGEAWMQYYATFDPELVGKLLAFVRAYDDEGLGARLYAARRAINEHPSPTEAAP